LFRYFIVRTLYSYTITVQSRMTDDRKQRLDAIGFRWSNTKLDKTSLNGIHAGAVLCRQSE
jgi:hypothetical protein